MPNKKNDEHLETFMRFARYCNGLTPYKLDEPYDPIVEGAIKDFAQNYRHIDSIKEALGEMEKSHYGDKGVKVIEPYARNHLRKSILERLGIKS